MKDRNIRLYFITVIIIIIIYLVIYFFGAGMKKSIYAEGYQQNAPKQPVNDILSIHLPEDSIIFSYDYTEGNHIELYNQFPTADEVGMAFVGEKYTHDFRLRFNYLALGMHYVITLKKQPDSNLDDDWAKVYLEADGVGIANCFRETGRVKTFNEYPSYYGNNDDKILYQGVITYAEAKRGYKDFTLRMWISEDVQVSNEAYLEKSIKARVTVSAVK